MFQALPSMRLLIVGVLAFFLWAFCTQADAGVKSEPAPINVASLPIHKNDLKALNDYEKQIESMRSVLSKKQTFSDAKLRFYRRQLESTYLDLEDRSKKYKSRINAADALMKEFALEQSKGGQSEDDKLKVDYDPYYLKKIREFKQDVAFYQGRLLQIRLLEFEIKAILRSITRLRSEVNRSGVFDKSTFIYQTDAWIDGYKQIKTFSSMIWQDAKYVANQMDRDQLWKSFSLVGVIFIILLVIYFYWIVPASVRLACRGMYNCDRSKKCVTWLFEVLFRGWIPALFIVYAFRLFFDWCQIDTLPLLLNVLRSLSNATAFMLVASAMVTSGCRLLDSDAGKGIYNLTTPLLMLSGVTALVLFINNINIFTVAAKAFPFYPAATIDLVNVILSVFMMAALFWLSHRMRKLLRRRNK